MRTRTNRLYNLSSIYLLWTSSRFNRHEERDGQYYEYEPSQISRDAVRKILENQTPNLVTLEYLIVKYPSLKEKLLPHLRDKKLDELIWKP